MLIFFGCDKPHAIACSVVEKNRLWSNENMNKKCFSVYICSVCTIACLLIWYGVYYVESQHNLIIHFFDVGQGDGIFFELPGSHIQVLIDGGPNGSILSKLGSVMPFWDRTIDLVILTHPHADHVDGLIDVLKRYDIGMVIESGVAYATPDYAEWNAVVKQKEIPVIYARKGQYVALSDIATLTILSPQEEIVGRKFVNIHDGMVVSKLTYGSTTILFTGDAEKIIEYNLISSGAVLNADILKIGHHGSKTSSAEGFLNAVRPQFAVISVGRKNRYGHPHADVVDRIQAADIGLFRTDIHGDVEFMSDGERVWSSY